MYILDHILCTIGYIVNLNFLFLKTLLFILILHVTHLGSESNFDSLYVLYMWLNSTIKLTLTYCFRNREQGNLSGPSAFEPTNTYHNAVHLESRVFVYSTCVCSEVSLHVALVELRRIVSIGKHLVFYFFYFCLYFYLFYIWDCDFINNVLRFLIYCDSFVFLVAFRHWSWEASWSLEVE